MAKDVGWAKPVVPFVCRSADKPVADEGKKRVIHQRHRRNRRLNQWQQLLSGRGLSQGPLVLCPLSAVPIASQRDDQYLGR